MSSKLRIYIKVCSCGKKTGLKDLFYIAFITKLEQKIVTKLKKKIRKKHGHKIKLWVINFLGE